MAYTVYVLKDNNGKRYVGITSSNTGKVRSDKTKTRIGKAKEKPIEQYSQNGILLAT